jgi:hypothetical protein
MATIATLIGRPVRSTGGGFSIESVGGMRRNSSLNARYR